MWLSAETDTSPTAGSLYSYSLGFANNGNVNSVTDSVMGASTPSYDHLNRLASSAYTAGLYNELTLSWSYDDFGNRTSQTPSGSYTGTVPGAQTLGFGNATNQITSGLSITYDAAGNVSEDPSNQYLYDGEGRLCAVYNNGGSGAMTGYVYDGDGNRVAKGGLSSFSCDSTTNGFTLSNAYILGQSGEQLDEADSTGTEVHSNTFANGQLLSTYDNITSEWTVALNDWLGTKRVQVDPAVLANLTSFTSLPYGDALTPSGYDATEQHFTGKERDTESGNDYFGARYYGSSMGRFMSPDPSGLEYADPKNPQSLNLYSYVLNNPLHYVDPTGLDCVYFNDAGNAAESVDHNSNSGECGQNGGDWVNGTTSASQVQYNANNDTFNIQSSSAFHNYNTTANAPGSQNDGTSCFGNCDTANGYKQSFKWPNFTAQIGLGANVSFWGPITGGVFVGLVVDSHGHVGGYSGGGGGLGVGAGASAGVQIGVSNGNGICSMGGPFGNASVSGGALGGGTVDVFSGEGDGPGGMVNGAAATLGAGGGAGASATVTGTSITPFGSHQCVGGKTQ